MTTKVSMETIDPVRRRLAVEVPEAEVSDQIERAYDELRRTARVRGFRPGRAPRAVLEQLFGDRVRADVFGRLVQESYIEALRDQNIDPVGQPEIVTESARPGEPLRYSAIVEVRPTVVASGYDGLEVESPLRRIADEDVARFLEQLRQSLAQLHPVSDRVRAESGDVAAVDYEARVHGRLVGRGEKRLLSVGDTKDVIGSRLEGAEVGSTIEFDVEDAGGHSDSEFAGERLSFRVVVRSLATKEVPVLDDEFAKDHGEVDTLEELRRRVRERLEAEALAEANRAARAAAVAQLVRLHDVEVPLAMVERRTAALVEQFLESLGPKRPPVSREAEVRQRLSADLASRASEQLKAELVLEAIARQEGIEIDEVSLQEHIDGLIERAGAAREKARAFYLEPAARASVRASLLENRALNLVIERAQVRRVEISGIAEGEGNG